MEKNLTQAQIDAMFGAGDASGPTPPIVEDFDFGSQRSLTTDQTQEIGDLSERFARSLASSLGAWLKADVTVGLGAVERASFQELMEGTSERGTYFASMQMDAVMAASLLQLDMQLGYCVLDLLLGGTGRPSSNRDLTHVDEQLFRAVMVFVCDELSSTWRTIGLTARFADRLLHTQITRLMPPDEQALCFTFEMRVGATQGNLMLTLPAAVSSFLLRQLSGSWKGHREHPPAVRERLMTLSRRIKYPVTLQLPSTRIACNKLSMLTVGQVVVLNIKEGMMPSLQVAGRSFFTASAVRQGEFRAALLREPVLEE